MDKKGEGCKMNQESLENITVLKRMIEEGYKFIVRDKHSDFLYLFADEPEGDDPGDGDLTWKYREEYLLTDDCIPVDVLRMDLNFIQPLEVFPRTIESVVHILECNVTASVVGLVGISSEDVSSINKTMADAAGSLYNPPEEMQSSYADRISDGLSKLPLGIVGAVATDVDKRIVDWLSGEGHRPDDPYILQQVKFVENTVKQLEESNVSENNI